MSLYQQLREANGNDTDFYNKYVFTGEISDWFKFIMGNCDIPITSDNIIMNYRDAYISMRSKDRSKYNEDNINHHDLGVSGLYEALNSINDFTNIMISKNKGEHGEVKLEFATPVKDKKGRNALAILEIDTIAKNGSSVLSVTVTTSVYGRRNIERYIQTAKDDGRYIDIKKETNAWFQAQGQPVPMRGTKYGFIRSIYDSPSIVNTEGLQISEDGKKQY